MSGRAWKFLLVGSLVLNVFLIGGVAGGAYQWFAAHGRTTATAAQPQPRALRFAAEELSVERQRQFVDALKDARREAREYAREGRDDRREVLRLLAAPQLDRTALDQALNRTREADIALRSRVEQGVADFAATLSPEERVKFAEGLRERGQWRIAQAQQQRQQQKQPAQNDQPASE
ncbi:periplasmic heavy metal sensor [Burkholderia sp. Ac-20365]|uniref:periplasmic heavy metal sensor n=1 Tax=Burkholderia sp. Ac-20365 TaxID=2703897 RepID=UPI00197C7C11|nr:periplasmic heavy metal sensor [Burkholderia sp. Ac-20365]MBN3766275.1 periplasmic heavy metal sensor [Burkholderia sp. Ac-20365]